MPPGEASTRSWPRMILVVGVILLVARVATSIYQARLPPPPSLVQWVPLEKAEARAAAENKPILYEFSASWCGPCQAMEREVFADREAADLINARFVPVRITDEDEGPKPQALRRLYHVSSIPLLIVAREQVVEQSVGYMGKRTTIGFLRRLAGK
jgi:thiol:disulfide interchange protein